MSTIQAQPIQNRSYSAVGCQPQNPVKLPKKLSRNFKLLVTYLYASPWMRSQRNISELKLSDIVDFNAVGGNISIIDRELFKALSWFCAQEFATKNLNAVLLIRAVDISNLNQVMAVVERLHNRIGQYRYQAHLPHIDYYQGSMPESLALSREVSELLLINYKLIHHALHHQQGQRKAKHELDAEYIMDLQLNLLTNFEQLKQQLAVSLQDTLERFKHNLTFKAAEVEAQKLLQSKGL
ncbi:MAG: hypothetical protein F6J87_09080 [Spirulina sp. SIO3F2]|nr:hypothetical protein [Spirulina sp. SIO3F2]